jgi:hypothetical protein
MQTNENRLPRDARDETFQPNRQNKPRVCRGRKKRASARDETQRIFPSHKFVCISWSAATTRPQRLVPLTSPILLHLTHHSISLSPVGELPVVVVLLPLHLWPHPHLILPVSPSSFRVAVHALHPFQASPLLQFRNTKISVSARRAYAGASVGRFCNN